MFRRVLKTVHEGPGKEASLAAAEAGEGSGRWDVGGETAEPEADGGGVALELGAAAGLALHEAGEKLVEGRGVEEGEEGPELGGVLPMLEGVEVAPRRAGAGSSAATPAGG